MRYVIELFAAIETRDESRQWRLLQSLSEADAVAVSTSLGPQRIRALLYRFVGQSKITSGIPVSIATQTAAAAMPQMSKVNANLESLLPIVLARAFKDATFVCGTRDAALESRVQRHLALIHAQRKARQWVELYRDVTHTMRPVTACYSPLSEQAYAEVAKFLNIEVAAIKAVSEVESKAAGHDEKSRPTVRFEANYFRRLTNGIYDLTHPHLSVAYPKSLSLGNWPNQYFRLYEAMVLDPVAAISSVSWGQFQVMGDNHSGWPDPISFAHAMQGEPGNHLKAFAAFVKNEGLIPAVQRKDWLAFANRYNGTDNAKNRYDTKISAAYSRYGGK